MQSPEEVSNSTGSQIYFSGKVKWFHTDRGFGFIQCDLNQKDIFFTCDELHHFTRNSNVSGHLADGVASRTSRGLRVVAFNSFDAPADLLSDQGGDMTVEPGYHPARVKWYDAQKGFGFVNVFSRRDDCLLQAHVLTQSGIESVKEGDALCVRIGERQGRKKVLELQSWLTPPPPAAE
ncbi:MAG: cold shock domain-containing protein [Pseudomonadota bacterium]